MITTTLHRHLNSRTVTTSKAAPRALSELVERLLVDWIKKKRVPQQACAIQQVFSKAASCKGLRLSTTPRSQGGLQVYDKGSQVTADARMSSAYPCLSAASCSVSLRVVCCCPLGPTGLAIQAQQLSRLRGSNKQQQRRRQSRLKLPKKQRRRQKQPNSSKGGVNKKSKSQSCCCSI